MASYPVPGSGSPEAEYTGTADGFEVEGKTLRLLPIPSTSDTIPRGSRNYTNRALLLRGCLATSPREIRCIAYSYADIVLLLR